MSADQDEPQIERRDYNRSSFQRDLTSKKEEIEEIETHYKDLIQIKEEHYAKINHKCTKLERDNETYEIKMLDLTEENKKLLKQLKDSEQIRFENEAVYKSQTEKVQKRYDDLKKVIETWKDLDLSVFMEGGRINEDLIKKKVHYYTEEIIINKQYIESLQDLIKNLEGENMSLKAGKNSAYDCREGFFDKLFGKSELKNEIKKLNNEKQVLNEKQENIIKLMKFHQIKIESNENQIKELEERIVYLQQNMALVKTGVDAELTQKLEETIAESKRKDLALDKMKERIDKLIKEKVPVPNNSIPDDVKLTIRNLEGNLNSKSMEYDQLEAKYKNAIEEINILLEKIKVLESSSTPIELSRNLRALNFDPKNYSSSITEIRSQVYEQSTDLTTCPNCGGNFSTDEIENHLEICLVEYS